jgi:membrane fusion protein (multidrug efflux system)
MRRNFSSINLLALLFTLVTGSAALAQAAPGARSTAPVEVGVVTLHPQSVPVTVDLPGRVSASQSADVRPQVSGIIKAIDYKAGKEVKAGDLLFEVDDAAYQAQVAVASATVQKAEAAVSSAQAKVTRYKQLVGNGVSQSDLDDANVAFVQAQADVASARATLRTAQLNLDLTKIAAPISGLINQSTVTQGALVTAAQTTALATIRLLDPIYVDLVDTSANLLNIRSQFEAGTLKGGGRATQPTVKLALEDGTTYAETGALTLTDVVVSESTGTFSLQATFPNSRRMLLPGMFVRATVNLGNDPSAYLVPQRAVTFNAAGQATALFAEGGKAVSHILTTDGSQGNDWLVTGGVTDGGQLIVDGFQKISDGSAVKPLEVTLDAKGVVTQTIPSTTATTTAPAAATKSGS